MQNNARIRFTQSIKIVLQYLLPVIVSEHNQVVAKILITILKPLVCRAVNLVHSWQESEVRIIKMQNVSSGVNLSKM